MRIKRGPTAKSRSPPAQDRRQLQFEPVSFQQGRSRLFFLFLHILKEACQMTMKKFGRFWAVYDGEQLVCLTVYKKGAAEVIRRLTTNSCKECDCG